MGATPQRLAMKSKAVAGPGLASSRPSKRTRWSAFLKSWDRATCLPAAGKTYPSMAGHSRHSSADQCLSPRRIDPPWLSLEPSPPCWQPRAPGRLEMPERMILGRSISAVANFLGNQEGTKEPRGQEPRRNQGDICRYRSTVRIKRGRIRNEGQRNKKTEGANRRGQSTHMQIPKYFADKT